MSGGMHYAYFGDHKCASTWIVAILHSLCREAGLTFSKYNELAGRPPAHFRCHGLTPIPTVDRWKGQG
jgi:hypothetical protein